MQNCEGDQGDWSALASKEETAGGAYNSNVAGDP